MTGMTTNSEAGIRAAWSRSSKFAEADPVSRNWMRADRPDYRNGTVAWSETRRWTGLTAILTEVHGNGVIQSDLSGASTSLSVVFDAAGGRVDIEGNDGQRVSAPSSQEPVSIISPNESARLRITGVRRFRHLLLRFDEEALTGLVDEQVDTATAFQMRRWVVDKPLLALCRLFANACAAQDVGCRLYGDSLSVALLLRLVQVGRDSAMPARPGGLTPWQFQRVLDHIEAHYADEVPLHTLANLTRLSKSYFSRAFKQSAGVSPHKWLITLRCVKAKQMLLEGQLPLAEIAAATGFADQSHFTRVFGQSNGMPPATWRRLQMSA